jgi:O-antigen ligase
LSLAKPLTQAVDPSARRLRWLLVATATAALLAGGSGVAQKALFSQPSNLKYGLTVAAPLFLVAVFTADEPLLVVVPAIVVAGPFGGLSATFAGTSVSVLVPLIALAVALAIATGPRPQRLSSTGWVVVPALVLLTVPFWEGSAHSRYLVLFGAMIVVGWLAARAASLPGGLRVVAWSLVASATIQGVIAIWEFRTGHLLNLYSTAGNNVFGSSYFFSYGTANRPTGSLYDPISLGNILALAIPVAMVLAATARTTTARLIALSAALVIGIGLTLSLSRMSWIGAAAGVVVTILFLPSPHRWRAALAALALAAAAVFLAVGFAHGSLGERFSSIFHPTSRTVRTAQGDQQRVELWRAGLTTAEAHPIHGVGLGNLLPLLAHRVGGLGPQSHAQSTYIQILGEAGIAGGLALLLLLSGLGRDLLRGLRRERSLYAGLAGAFAAMLITWLTDYTLRYAVVATTFAVLFGAIASRAARPVA